MPTVTVTYIANPIKAGNRRPAVAGPAASRRIQTLTVRTMLVSVAQIAQTVIRVHGVPAGVQVHVPAYDEDERRVF
jgi:hypothetical protein